MRISETNNRHSDRIKTVQGQQPRHDFSRASCRRADANPDTSPSAMKQRDYRVDPTLTSAEQLQHSRQFYTDGLRQFSPKANNDGKSDWTTFKTDTEFKTEATRLIKEANKFKEVKSFLISEMGNRYNLYINCRSEKDKASISKEAREAQQEVARLRSMYKKIYDAFHYKTHTTELVQALVTTMRSSARDRYNNDTGSSSLPLAQQYEQPQRLLYQGEGSRPQQYEQPQRLSYQGEGSRPQQYEQPQRLSYQGEGSRLSPLENHLRDHPFIQQDFEQAMIKTMPPTESFNPDTFGLNELQVWINKCQGLINNVPKTLEKATTLYNRLKRDAIYDQFSHECLANWRQRTDTTDF